MIRMLLVLVIVALGVVLVSNSLKRAPTNQPDGQVMENPVQEAERVKALLESQQQLLEQRAEQVKE